MTKKTAVPPPGPITGDGTGEALPPIAEPGDKDYDWAKEYGTDDLFTYTLPNGKMVALKAFGNIFSKTWLFKIRNLKTNVDVELAAIDRGTCDTAKQLLEDLDDADGDPISDLWAAWTSDEGVTSGN